MTVRHNDFALRETWPQDYDFCQRLYVEATGDIPAAPDLGLARPSDNFDQQWVFAKVRIITCAAGDVGWLQTAPTDDAIDVGQLYVDRRFQRQGIGHGAMRLLIAEAGHENKAVTLGVVKRNPARRIYERLGFQVTYEDRHEVYMRRDPAPVPA